MSCAFLPLLRPRFFLIALAPLLLMQSFSGHAWHATYYGHYSYTVLPLLLYGSLLGLARLRAIIKRYFSDERRRRAAFAATGFFCLSLVAYSAAGDRESPGVYRADRKTARRAARLELLLRKLPVGACLRTQARFSSRAPLDVQVFPLSRPGRGSYDFQSAKNCRGRFLLLDARTATPFHSPAVLKQERRKARRAMRLVKTADSLELYAAVNDDSSVFRFIAGHANSLANQINEKSETGDL